MNVNNKLSIYDKLLLQNYNPNSRKYIPLVNSNPRIPLLPGIFMDTGYFLPLTCVFRPLTEKAFTFILDTV